MEGMDERDQPARFDRRHCDLARSFWLPGAPGWQGAAMTLPAGSKPRGRGSTRGPPRSPPSAPASAPPSAPPSAPSSRQGRGDAGAAVGRGRQAMLTYGFEFLPLWCAEILFARIGREDVRRPLHWDVDPGLIGACLRKLREFLIRNARGLDGENSND